MQIELMDYQDGNQTLEAAVAFPRGDAKAPAVLVVHQWAGRGDGESQTAERLADLGYVGVAIDVFGKGIRGSDVGDNTHLLEPWMADRAALLRRLQAAITFARTIERVDASAIAAIGYCFGGLCALDIARCGNEEVRGVVSIHGTLDGNALGQTGPIVAKVLVQHGWLDPFARPEQVVTFATEMEERGADWQLHVHGQAMHAFTHVGIDAAEYGMAYNADAERRSWVLTAAFLAELFARGTSV